MDKFVVCKRKSVESIGGVSKKRLSVEDSDVSQLVKTIKGTDASTIKWCEFRKRNLVLDYNAHFLPTSVASMLFRACERDIDYFSGDLAKVKVFGKWHDIPRKHVAFGDKGLTYKFSHTTVPANPWPSYLDALRNLVSDACGHQFNFVLVNRYANGKEYMGEHKDDEAELMKDAAIASVSLGQPRDFVFRHEDAKLSGRQASPDCQTPLKIELGHGSLLVMRHPTNQYWYHSLPKRAHANGVRLNFTFRVMQM